MALAMAASTAQASVFIATESQMQVQLAALPTIQVQGSWTGLATVSNGAGTGHDVAVPAGIFTTAGNSAGTSLLTGVALITNLTLTADNLAGTFTSAFNALNPVGGSQTPTTPSSVSLCPSGCLGGTQGFTGQFVLGILGVAQVPFPLNVVGVGGQTNLPLGQGVIVATGGPFITGKMKITGVTTNVISMPGRGGVTGVGVLLAPAATEEVKTFTTNGGFITSNPGGNLETLASVVVGGDSDLTSASAGGTVTLISPLRVNTGPLGVNNIPGVVTERLVFAAVPEPGTVLLLVSGAAGLVLIGRSRMRK
jgi:hypothetical protein